MAAAGTAALAAGALVVVLGSSPSGAEAPTPVAALAEVTGPWQATTAPDAPTELVEPVRLTFGAGGVFVETGCNTGRGAAAVEDGRLVTGPLATTRKGCTPPLATQETWVLGMLVMCAGPVVARHPCLLDLRDEGAARLGTGK